MSGIQGKQILITGASAGIGEACARRCANEGAHLILWARRGERLQALAEELGASGIQIRTGSVDLRDREAVRAEAAAVMEAGATPDVLINNAGLASGMDLVQEGKAEDWDRMIDTNVKGLLHVSRAFLPEMIRLGRGHVVNVGSIAGHAVYQRGNVYNATKFAVRALTEGMNLDLAGTPLRVSSVDPGYVHTEFSLVRFAGDHERADSIYEGFQPLSADDVADAICYVISTPGHVNVFDLVLLPTAQRNLYMVDRQES